MKAIFVILTACVATGLCQTVPSFTQCFTQNIPEFLVSNAQCYQELTTTIKWLSSDSITADDLSAFCMSGCSTTVNEFFQTRCEGLAVSEAVCAKDESGDFCIESSMDSAIGIRLGEISGNDGECPTATDTDCSDATCNNAFESLSCCVAPLDTFVIQVLGGVFGRVPVNCSLSLPTCPEAQFGGTPPSVAMPLSILVALVAALAAVL